MVCFVFWFCLSLQYIDDNYELFFFWFVKLDKFIFNSFTFTLWMKTKIFLKKTRFCWLVGRAQANQHSPRNISCPKYIHLFHHSSSFTSSNPHHHSPPPSLIIIHLLQPTSSFTSSNTHHHSPPLQHTSSFTSSIIHIHLCSTGLRLGQPWHPQNSGQVFESGARGVGRRQECCHW